MIEIEAALLAGYDCKAASYTSEFWFTTSPVFDTTPPGGRAAADGLCWHTSRESHPSEDLSELPPLLDPGIIRGCGWTGVSLSDCWRGSGWVNQPQCETARHRLLCGRMGTALHLPWPSLMRAHGPHRWSWRILQRRFSPPLRGPLVSGRIPLPDMKFSKDTRETADYRYSQYRANWARMLFMT